MASLPRHKYLDRFRLSVSTWNKESGDKAHWSWGLAIVVSGGVLGKGFSQLTAVRQRFNCLQEHFVSARSRGRCLQRATCRRPARLD